MCYTTAGAGHRRAAEAVAQAARARWPGRDVACVDILEHTPRWFRWFYAASYLFLVRYASWLWHLGYMGFDQPWLRYCIDEPRRMWNRFVARRFLRWLRDRPPAAVLAAHFMPADVCGWAKRAGWLRAPLIVIVTDLHPHRFWLTPEAEAIVVATEDGRRLCRERGVPPERLHVVGIPVTPPGSEGASPQASPELFGLRAGRRTILVTSGGTTVGPFAPVVQELLTLEQDLPGRLQLLVVCGSNEAAVKRLRRVAARAAMPATVVGFIDTMPQAIAAADLVVAKAGGLTTAEALGQGRPLVIYHMIPGQEEFNAAHAADRGAAVIATRPRAVGQAVRELFQDPARLERMRRAAESLGRPDAAARIVSDILEPLLTR